MTNLLRILRLLDSAYSSWSQRESWNKVWFWWSCDLEIIINFIQIAGYILRVEAQPELGFLSLGSKIKYILRNVSRLLLVLKKSKAYHIVAIDWNSGGFLETTWLLIELWIIIAICYFIINDQNYNAQTIIRLIHCIINLTVQCTLKLCPEA